jgi:hypothetical protein
MRYMLLIYSKEGETTSEKLEACRQAHISVLEETARRGILVSAGPLEPTETATTVRVVNGRPLISDGPFAETKEQLGGYYLLECADLDEAIEWASRIPTDCFGAEGSVEIRPMRAVSEKSELILSGASFLSNG